MYDFAIIGGGIAGLAAAANLAPIGSCILLEEQGFLGSQASGRSAALFLEPYGNPAVRELNRASAPELEALGVLRKRPFLFLAQVEHEELLEAEMANFGATEISTADAKQMLPILDVDAVSRAALFDGASDIDTDLLMQHCKRTARSHGAEIVTGAPLRSANRRAESWDLECQGTSIKAARLVNAAGAWADQIAVLCGVAPIDLQPFRRSFARLPAPGGRDTSSWAFCLDIAERWYARPDAGAWLVSPGDEDPMTPHDAWADDMVIAEGLERYMQMVTEPVTHVQTTWAGLRSFVPDGSLVLGPDPADERFLWCAGQGGYGFQTSLAASRLLADLVSGRMPTLTAQAVKGLLPDRLRTD